MSAIDFAALPDDARLWVFPAPRRLSNAEAGAVLEQVDRFLDEWHAHGHAVVGARELRDQQFLFIAADERATGVSGCSTDSMMRVLKALESELGLALTDQSPLWYRDAAGAVRAVSRPEFRQLAASGDVGADTVVFDHTVPTVGALREGRWETRAGKSWHARLLGGTGAAAL